MFCSIESYGLAVEHSAHDQKVVDSIPVQSNARWKWCQSQARLLVPGHLPWCFEWLITNRVLGSKKKILMNEKKAVFQKLKKTNVTKNWHETNLFYTYDNSNENKQNIFIFFRSEIWDKTFFTRLRISSFFSWHLSWQVQTGDNKTKFVLYKELTLLIFLGQRY